LLVKIRSVIFTVFPFGQTDDYHATGDLARMDDNNNVVLMGRKKEMIIRVIQIFIPLL